MAANRVAEGQVVLGVEHFADCLDTKLVEHREGHVNPGPGGFRPFLGIEELTDRRLVLRGDDHHVGGVGRLFAGRLEQLAAAGDLVQENQKGLAHDGAVTVLGWVSGTSAPSPSPPMIA